MRRGFTLIEVLIAVTLLALIVPALFRTTSLLHRSNKQLQAYTASHRVYTEALETLFDDIAASDGNITILKEKFDRLCMSHTRNTLYELEDPSVCWGVTKERRRLVRLEGVKMPMASEENVFMYADEVLADVEVLEASYDKKRVVVVLQVKGEEPTAFVVYGISPPPLPKKKPRKKPNNKPKSQSPAKVVKPRTKPVS